VSLQAVRKVVLPVLVMEFEAVLLADQQVVFVEGP